MRVRFTAPSGRVLSALTVVLSVGQRRDSAENKTVKSKGFPGKPRVRSRNWFLSFRSRFSSFLCCGAAAAAEQLELVGELLKELSQGQAGDQGPKEHRGTLLELLKVAREDSPVVWEEHFKTTLLLLLETLGDKDVRTPPVSTQEVLLWLILTGSVSVSTWSERWPYG